MEMNDERRLVALETELRGFAKEIRAHRAVRARLRAFLETVGPAGKGEGCEPRTGGFIAERVREILGMSGGG